MLKVLVVKDPSTNQAFTDSEHCSFCVVTPKLSDILTAVERDRFDILLLDYRVPSPQIADLKDLFPRPIAIFMFNSGANTIALHYLEYVADIIQELPKDGNQGEFMYEIWSQHFMRSLERIQKAAESAANLFALKVSNP